MIKTDFVRNDRESEKNMETVSEKALAKLNLYLEITGRRADGYHAIESVMQSVSLCDRVTVSAARGADATESEKMNFGGSDPPICKREGLVTSRKLAAPACKK